MASVRGKIAQRSPVPALSSEMAGNLLRRSIELARKAYLGGRAPPGLYRVAAMGDDSG